MTTAPVLTFDEFRAELARETGVAPDRVTPDADLRRDLQLDSIQMFLLLVAVEDLGVTFPEEMLPHILTVGDAYNHYVTASGHLP